MEPNNRHRKLRYTRRKSTAVQIGNIPLGSEYPIRVQSMTNTLTSDTKATSQQIIHIKEAGADYVRFTVPARSDAENIPLIIDELKKKSCFIPVIADIHFNPQLAFISATSVDKVRINPGNFIDRKHFTDFDYTDEEYNKELEKVYLKFVELLNICRKHSTALRIGTNHGSLSDRIMSRYGDTPEGMAESAMEFLRICQAQDFKEVVVSMKSSNTRVMVQATRLLVDKMEKEQMAFPLHLGVTEAGEGEDGRIKSAVGIGTLLAEGIGDTIRVSLTEDPELEIPVARKIVDYIKSWEDHSPVADFGPIPIDLFSYQKRSALIVNGIGDKLPPVVMYHLQGDISVQRLAECGWHYSRKDWHFSDLAADMLIVDTWPDQFPVPEQKKVIIPFPNNQSARWSENFIPLFSLEKYLSTENSFRGAKFVEAAAGEINNIALEVLKRDPDCVIVLSSDNINGYLDQRSAIFRMMNAGVNTPVVLKRKYQTPENEDFQLQASIDVGGMFIDGLADGICLEGNEQFEIRTILETAFGILQASRVRVTKTEYISCPSCGRTLFDLQSTTKLIRERTAHLKGLKLGIMGCIVNGPGEMADADYGYVGAGPGKVTLYKEKTLVKKNIPADEAVEELIRLIKENGDWVDP